MDGDAGRGDAGPRGGVFAPPALPDSRRRDAPREAEARPGRRVGLPGVAAVLPRCLPSPCIRGPSKAVSAPAMPTHDLTVGSVQEPRWCTCQSSDASL